MFSFFVFLSNIKRNNIAYSICKSYTSYALIISRIFFLQIYHKKLCHIHNISKTTVFRSILNTDHRSNIVYSLIFLSSPQFFTINIFAKILSNSLYSRKIYFGRAVKRNGVSEWSKCSQCYKC